MLREYIGSTEITKYNAIVKMIKPHAQRLNAKGEDTFTLSGFWRENEGEVPAFSYVLRAVLSNAPNSIPPERVSSSSIHIYYSISMYRQGILTYSATLLSFDETTRAGHMVL